MGQSLLKAISRLVHDHEADEDNEVDTSEVVDEPGDQADSEAVERLVDSKIDERENEIDHVASKGGNVEFRSVDGDANRSDDCLAATSCPPPTHRCQKS